MSFITINIAAIVLTLLLSRLSALYFFNKYALKKASSICLKKSKKTDPKISKIVARQLFAFGGWVTISNLIYPLMMQSDRLLIGMLISATAVATYVIPYDMVIQSLILCGAITTTIFPILSGLAKSEPEKIKKLFLKWLVASIAVMSLVTCIFLFFSDVLFKLWLGSSLNEESVMVARILSIGLVPYALGSMYLALIHAYSRPDITAKAHLVEIPLFLLILYWAVSQHGITGAAIVWVGRVMVDAILLICWFHRYFNFGNKNW
jgi:O-antigen/teichoic acid export membrane protein